MASSVLRRYTPPTCTLEIAATGSALSRWTDRAVLKNLRFQLSFDDPKLPSDQQVTIRGDRTQLEALWEAVSSYVQTLLGASVDHWTDPSPSPDPAPIQPIYLQPQGRVAHELRLGPLAADESVSVVRLTALQLFDLANALDDYHAEALTLPTLVRPAWAQSPMGWAKVAAAAVVAIGVSIPMARFVMDVSNPPAEVASRQVELKASQTTDPTPTPAALPTLAAPPSLKLEPVPLPPPTGSVQPPPSPTAAVPIPGGFPSNLAPTALPQQPVVIEPSLAPLTPAPDRIAVVPSPTEGSETSNGVNQGINETQPNMSGSSQQAPAAMSGLNPSGRSMAESAPMADASVSPSTAAGTAFDAIPQVAEVRDYFQKTWQPPQGLNQTLEYRLLLNADGSIQRVVPLGETAANFIDRTNMPLMNEPFVSPIASGRLPQIRLVLSPNGDVQTFLEYVN